MFFESPTLEMMIFDVLNIYNNGRTDKDVTVSEDQISFWIISKRDKYLRQKIAKGEDLRDYSQDLGCIELEFVDKAECCNVDIGCEFLRTKVPVPLFLGDPTRIGPVDPLARPWQPIAYPRIPFEKYAPWYSKKFIKTFSKDFTGYQYIYYDPEYAPQGKFLKYMNIQAVLVDPTMAVQFNNCNTGTSCFDPKKDPFPISLSLWNDIRKDILMTELKLTEMTTTDTTNNNQSDKNLAPQQNAK